MAKKTQSKAGKNDRTIKKQKDSSVLKSKSKTTKTKAQKDAVAKQPKKTSNKAKSQGKPLIIRSSSKEKKVEHSLSKSEKDILKKALLSMRERLTGNMLSLKEESLLRHDSSNSEEDGTDAFERQMALGLVDNEHEKVVAIDEALQRLEEGTYGICETCSGRIEIARLKALPFVKNCIACQSEKEKASGRTKPILPLGNL